MLTQSTSYQYSMVGAVTIFVTLLACSSSRGTIRNGKFIFTEFINITGWSDGVAWIMGLLQTQYSLVGADGAAHIVDEIDNPRRNAPMAMVLSCLIGGVSALIVCISFLAATTDPIAVAEALGGGSLVVIVQGVGNYGGATVLSIIFLRKLMSFLARTISFLIYLYFIAPHSLLPQSLNCLPCQH